MSKSLYNKLLLLRLPMTIIMMISMTKVVIITAIVTIIPPW